MSVDPIPSEVRDFLTEVGKNVSGELRTDTMSRILYSTDASMYEMVPHGVLIPRTPDDIDAAVELAAKHRVPLLPRGGGSSLAGQAVGTALILDLTRWLDRVVSFDQDRGRVTVQTGLVLDRLNEFLRPSGWMVGPDPASSNRATIGGMIGNNATGTHSILYGSTVDHVHSLKVTLADGANVVLGSMDRDTWKRKATAADLFDSEARIIRELDRIVEKSGDVIRRDTPRHWRRSGGYRLERLLSAADGPSTINLAHMLCGSEGTLGVVTEATLNLVRRPATTGLGIVHFRTRMEALKAVPTILETNPSAIELFDRHGIEQCRQSAGYSDRLTFVDGEPDALLLTEYYGHSEDEVKSKLEELRTLSNSRGVGYTVVPLLEPAAIANVWDVRKGALGLILGIKGDFKPVAFIEDASVPPEHLAEYISELEMVLAETQTTATMYAHASAGCLHVRPFINTKDANEVRKMAEIGAASMRLVKKFGGTLASEHGEGLARGSFAEEFYGPELYDLYRQTKTAFDPAGIMNPGKVVGAPPMTEHLRIGPEYTITTLPVMAGHTESNLDFSHDHGFDRAVELCTGIGSCRKLDSGTMCPSFMVTRDEKHSTRGRANALRAAMQGRLGPKGLAEHEMYDVMSLCISCKACKTECQSSVDMARLKLEWQDRFWKSNKMPRRDRLFARMPELARRYSGRLAPFVNTLMKMGGLGGLAQRTIGVSPKRALPGFAKESLLDWHAKHRSAGDGSPIKTAHGATKSKPRNQDRRVILFADTFNTYQESEIGITAVQLLEQLGYDVSLSGRLCCGRTYLSKGLVDKSRALADEVVETLYPSALEGTPIVGLEPSCILSLRDEYHALLPRDPRVEVVAEHARTFEEFILDEAEAGRIDRSFFADHGRAALVHGHCHQKSLVGMEPSRRMLELAGYAVEIVDSGCCGMAGSFGYEAEHYHWSIQMAERVLAPTIRKAPPETVVIAAGTSCRAQISDTAGRSAIHPVSALQQALRT